MILRPTLLKDFKRRITIGEELTRASLKIKEKSCMIPDIVYDIEYKIDGKSYSFNLKKIFDVNVNELTELTLSNLRVALEQISSIRMTLERAYEQVMEDYGKWGIEYDIWWADMKDKAREEYWKNQKNLTVKYELAKSSIKPPTEDDLISTVLNSIGWALDYKVKKEQQIKFQRTKSLYEKLDDILNNRAFSLKTIIDSRVSKNG